MLEYSRILGKSPDCHTTPRVPCPHVQDPCYRLTPPRTSLMGGGLWGWWCMISCAVCIITIPLISPNVHDADARTFIHTLRSGLTPSTLSSFIRGRCKCLLSLYQGESILERPTRFHHLNTLIPVFLCYQG